MIKSLKDIPRIGEKTARRFIDHFGSEKTALDAILNGDIAGITEIEGMTERSAISLVLEALARNEGVNIRDFLKTAEVYEIYERILALICESAHTDHARSKLQLYFPCPSTRKDVIIRHQKKISSVIEMTAGLDEKELSGYLSGIKPVKTNINIPAVRDRVIIAATQDEFEAAKIFPVPVHLVSDVREAVDTARGYSHVFTGSGFAGMDFPEDIDVEVLDIRKAQVWQVAPEKELAFFAKNYDSISSAISAFRTIRQHIPDFCSRITGEEVERLSSGLSRISRDADLKSGIDSEIDRCRSIVERLNDVAARAERRADSEFSALIEKSSVTVKGFDLLTAMDGSAGQIFEKEIREKYNAVTASAIRAVSGELGLNPAEAHLVSNFFGEEVSHPVRMNPRGMEELKNHLLRSISSRKLLILRDNAHGLSGLKETAKTLVREVLDFDVGYTIGCFSRKYGLNIPVFMDRGGIGIQEGANLFLDSPVPIDYAVGGPGENIGRLKDARVVLLSGVNSGGKTSTLDLLAQVIILAHMGFPVPAKKCEIGLVEEFYYFGKSRGTMDAGAFEITIRNFSAVANKKSKIVLADEMESITEPGASAKIISGILEELDDNNGIGVFVSHLAEAILKNTDHEIRVDGIEAKGLDENFNLIVDRNPRYNYLARSTPELIVERLAGKDDGNEFYGRLLKKFRQFQE